MSAVHSLSQNMFHAVVLTSIWYYVISQLQKKIFKTPDIIDPFTEKLMSAEQFLINIISKNIKFNMSPLGLALPSICRPQMKTWDVLLFFYLSKYEIKNPICFHLGLAMQHIIWYIPLIIPTVSIWHQTQKTIS
jgi:hypothetical protein